MKTFILMLSKTFPTTHPKAGKPTFFDVKLNGVLTPNGTKWQKLHTIRNNYNLWYDRMDKVIYGDAILSIREWTGKPYNSKMIEIARLGKNDGVGLQKLWFDENNKGVWIFNWHDINGKYIPIEKLAFNDGLTINDWKAWFKGCDLRKPLAIIHFTDFRY